MALADMIPTMEDKALANLRQNAVRLEADGKGPRQQEAADLLPLIDAELAERESRKPKKAPPKPRAKKAAKAA